MSMMKKLLEAMNKFAGEPEQKPGEQWKGTDPNPPGKKLVGDSIIKDLSKGLTPKTKEQELAEEWAKFMEADLGVEEKRPAREGTRPARDMGKSGEPSKRYNKVKDQGISKEKETKFHKKLDTLVHDTFGKRKEEVKEYKIAKIDNFTADDIKELEGIKDLATLKARAFALISKPSARPMKPEKVQWFKNRLESLVSPMAVIKLMWDLLLSGEGQRVIGSRSSMSANSYRRNFGEGWHGGGDRVHLPEEPSTYWSGDGALQKEYNDLYEKLVPASGPADTIEGEVLRAASKIVYRFYNDGDEFNAASFNQLKPYIGTVSNYDDLAHKATEFALKANGNYHPNAGWDCLDVMEYGPADYDDGWDEEDEYDDEDDTNWDEEEDVYESVGETFDNGDAVTLKPEYADTDADEIFTVSRVDNERQRCWISSWHGGRGWYVTFDQITLVDDDEWDEPPAGADDDSDLIDDESLWEGAADRVYTINIVRERMMGPSSTRTTSGTLSELLDYFSYTLETGKSYERERGRYKINMTPKNIQSLVDNLNKAKSNAAANGYSSTYYEVADAEVAESDKEEFKSTYQKFNDKVKTQKEKGINWPKEVPTDASQEDDDEDDPHPYNDDWKDDRPVDEGRGDSKGLHKQVKIVKGRDAGKTGWVRQIKTDKLRNRVYLDLDLEDGGQAVVLKQDVRLVKDVTESYTGRETKDGVWRVFKDGQAVAAAGPFKSAEEANSWIKKQNRGVAEARTTWNNDFYVYDPKTKAVKKKFRTHKGAKQYAEANGLKVASAEYYHDSVSKEVDEGMEEFAKSQAAKRAAARKERSQTKEGWESGPEEPTRVERDPDAEYDARRQEKLDAPFAKKEPEAKGYQVVSLDTRKPVTDEVFPTKGHAMAYIQSNYSKNLAFRAINEHGDQDGYEPWGSQDLKPGQKALKGKPVKAKATSSLAKDAFTKAFGGTAKDLTRNLSIRKSVSEDIESADPVESAILDAVQELIQQGHTEVAPEVITNMVVASTSQPFLLKDLVDANNNSPAIQHYVDSINPTKVKFSSDILTVKNEDPAKDKQKAQAGVSSMAARAASRSRLGEGNTPLRNQDDYDAKRKALQDIQLDPDTHKDPQLKAEVANRLATLNKEYAELSTKLREFKESRGHKAIATKLANMDRMKTVQIPTPAERQEQIRIAKEKESGKKQVKEYGANQPTGTAGQTSLAGGTGTAINDPKQAQAVKQATQTLKTATGSTAPTTSIAKALDTASQGKPAMGQEAKAIEPLMKDIATVAQDPKLAGQFKSLLGQVNQTQLKQQQQK